MIISFFLIIRIIETPSGTELKKQSFVVAPAPQKTVFTVREERGAVAINSKDLQIKIDRKSGAIGFYTISGKMLLREKDGSAFNQLSAGGHQIKQVFQLENDEPIYGLGQHQAGLMSQRNQSLLLKQNNMQIAVPFFQSIKGYCVYWDNYSATNFKDGADGTSFESEVGDGIDYYFIYGGDADKVIAGYIDG